MHLLDFCTAIAILIRLTFYPVQASTTLDLQIELDEESPPGTVVADMRSVFNLPWEERTGRRFKLLKEQFETDLAPDTTTPQLVAVDHETGIIKLLQKIDRDRECGSVKKCILQVQAVMLPQEVFSFLNLEIVINDINDNSPKFSPETITVNVSESAQVGDIFSLDQYQALDIDAGNNSKLSYSLSHNVYFDIRHFLDEAERPHLQLVLRKKLDYEKRAERYFTLTAKDNGSPARTARATIQIRVIDSNDNKPVFELAEFVVSLSENLKPGTNICQIHATDGDSGKNGIVQYFIVKETGTGGGFVGTELLTVDPESGIVSLRQKLDREIHDSLRVQIEARDGGSPPFSARTWLVLQVDDVNDNAPSIKIEYLVNSDKDHAYIMESIPVGSYIAYVSASDVDRGRNGEVIISISTHAWESEGMENEVAGYFSLAGDGLIETGKAFNSTREKKLRMNISACDNGTPRRCSFYNVSFELMDENDNAPVFDQSIYSVTLPESAEVGSYITTVQASDADAINGPTKTINENEEVVISTNGNVRYSIEDKQDTFSINSETGRISLIRPLDYEEKRDWKITVTGQDEGKPISLKTTCLLKVNVIDINDNPPLFINPALDEAIIYASILRNESIIKIQAIDYDSDKFSHVKLKLQSVDGADISQTADRDLLHTFFIFDPKLGELYLNMSHPNLESSVGEHHLTIEASDSGKPPLSTKTDITVHVVNTWVLPTPPTEDRDELHSTFNFYSSIFMIIIPLSAVVVLIVAVLIIILVCKKNKKKIRSYNCRAAESKNGCEQSPDPADSSKYDDTTKSIASNDVASQVTVNERISNVSSASATSQQKTFSRDNGIRTPRTSTSVSIAVPNRETSAFNHVLPSVDRPRTLFCSLSGEGKVVQTKPMDHVSQLQFQNDGDSGRGDSETDNGSCSGANERDYGKYHRYPFSNLSGNRSLRYESTDPDNHLGSRCTAECQRFGHSDTCWMPPSGFHKANVANQPAHDSTRILETIKETVDLEPEAIRENLRRSVCLALLASEGRLHRSSLSKRVHHSEELTRHFNLWADDYDSPSSVFGTPHSNSPAPSCERCGSVSNSIPPTNFPTFTSNKNEDVFLHNDNYLAVTGSAADPLLGRVNHNDSLCRPSMQDTQQMIDSINKMLIE